MQIRLFGRAKFVEFNRDYPEGWSIEVLRLADETQRSRKVRVPHPTVGPSYALSFFELEGGHLVSGPRVLGRGALREGGLRACSLVRADVTITRRLIKPLSLMDESRAVVTGQAFAIARLRCDAPIVPVQVAP